MLTNHGFQDLKSSSIPKELLECRDYSVLHCIKKGFQDKLNGVLRRITNRTFVELYATSELAFHFHSIIRLSGIEQRFDFRPVPQRCPSDLLAAPGVLDSFSTLDNGRNQIQMSVFVDVRNLSQCSKNIGYTLSMIRLHALDKFKCIYGNAGQNTFKTIVNRFSTNVGPQGKKTMLFPIAREINLVRIELYEIERKVIEGRSELVDDLPYLDGNQGGRGLDDVDSLLAVWVVSDFIRFAGGIRSDAIIKRFEMLLRSEELNVCGCQPDHSAEHISFDALN